jgi:hypothetical protein
VCPGAAGCCRQLALAQQKQPPEVEIDFNPPSRCQIRARPTPIIYLVTALRCALSSGETLRLAMILVLVPPAICNASGGVRPSYGHVSTPHIQSPRSCFGSYRSTKPREPVVTLNLGIDHRATQTSPGIRGAESREAPPQRTSSSAKSPVRPLAVALEVVLAMSSPTWLHSNATGQTRRRICNGRRFRRRGRRTRLSEHNHPNMRAGVSPLTILLG